MKDTILTALANVFVAPLCIMVLWIAMLLGLILVLMALMILVPLGFLYSTIHPTPFKSWLLG